MWNDSSERHGFHNLKSLKHEWQHMNPHVNATIFDEQVRKLLNVNTTNYELNVQYTDALSKTYKNITFSPRYEGHGGWATYHILEKLVEWRRSYQCNPELVLLHVGLNDCNPVYDLVEYPDAYKKNGMPFRPAHADFANKETFEDALTEIEWEKNTSSQHFEHPIDAIMPPQNLRPLNFLSMIVEILNEANKRAGAKEPVILMANLIPTCFPVEAKWLGRQIKKRFDPSEGKPFSNVHVVDFHNALDFYNHTYEGCHLNAEGERRFAERWTQAVKEFFL